MNLRPLNDRVVVEPVEQETTTASGLVLPETAKEKPQQGKVLAVGPGARDEDGERMALDLEVGDMVLFAKYAGTEIKIDGNKVLIMKENDILGVLEG
ncbi:MAG: co-chaperone GroES [Phototrophicaceae bacterium]